MDSSLTSQADSQPVLTSTWCRRRLGWRPRTAVGGAPASVPVAAMDPRGARTDATAQAVSPARPPPSPVVTVMFYGQSLDGVSGKHFSLSFIKGSNRKSISLINR